MPNRSADAVLKQLEDKNAPVLNLLAECRTDLEETIWKQGPALHRQFARLLLKQGHPTLALEVAARGLDKDRYPSDHRLLYCRAIALVNCGNPSRGDQFIQELLALADLTTAVRSDALSLAGRICKDRAGRTADPAKRLSLLRNAYGYYLQAYKLSGDTFPGINAASMAALIGLAEASRAIASEVRDKVLAELDKPDKDKDYWPLATLGEAYLLLGDTTAAMGRYRQAVRFANEAHCDGDIVSMRRNVLLLRQGNLHIGDELLSVFRLGPVVVFAGHGIDWPGDPVRFPNDRNLEDAVKRAIKIELDALECSIGYCSPGCGSDILFGELMRDHGAELHVILPFAENDFIIERLTYGTTELKGWQDRYDNLAGFLRVTKHFATTEDYLNDYMLYDFAGTFMQGLALTRAAQVGVEAIALVVQDPASQQLTSGLGTFVENWSKTKRELRRINLADLRSRVQLTAPPLTVQVERQHARWPREVRSMLFADVAGFSGLKESHLPVFFMEFLHEVKAELEHTPTLFQNTWGDGLYIVFADVLVCARFALNLLERLEDFDFSKFEFKLSADKRPGVRIGLHTGPVFKGWDAVLERDNIFGSHVSRAARIEPVTAPGCAFVSEQFAAALALAPQHPFVCEYLGLQPLDKNYDTCPLYRLTLANANANGQG